MKTQGYTVRIDELVAGAYQLMLIPSADYFGAMAITHFRSRDFLLLTLRRHLPYEYFEKIERLIAGGEQHPRLMNVPLTDDDAAALGWGLELH